MHRGNMKHIQCIFFFLFSSGYFFVNQSNPEQRISIPLSAFVRIDSKEKPNKKSYYTIESATNDQYINAHYIPPCESMKLGFEVPDTLKRMKNLSWQWRVRKPPLKADERIRGKNDSGAAVYLLFKQGIKVYVVKYVFSTVVPQGTIIRHDPLYPIQRLSMIVATTWNESECNSWKSVSVDIKNDFKRAFALKECPPLQGIGIMSDGDGTDSEIIADYKQFIFSGGSR